MKKTRLRIKGVSDTATVKQDIQDTVRAIVIIRDGGCILRKIRNCYDSVLQADHLITRANSATYADTRLIVCICRSCHGWKKWNEIEYNNLVRQLISPERVKLWDACQKDREAHRTRKMDWKVELLALKQELHDIQSVQK